MTNPNDFINKIETERSSDDFHNFSRVFSTGLTKREYFAAKFLAAIISGGTGSQEDKIRKAFEYTDEFIKKLNQPLTD